jgi:hypothetical protein
MAISAKEKTEKEDVKELPGDELLETRRQEYADWEQKRADFHNGNPSLEDVRQWEEENGAHPCEKCNGTGIAGGPPPKPLLKTGQEPVVKRLARTHAEIEVPPSGKGRKKAKDEDDK